MTPERRHVPARGWPVDPDLDADEDYVYSPRAVATRLLRKRIERPTIHASHLAAVCAGGFVGGLVRYEVVTTWPETVAGFPWSTFAVNTAGAFVLGLLVIVVLEVLAPGRLLRPLIGTGFCGALTTFGSLVVGADRLAAHGHPGLAAGYLIATLVAGVTAAAAGVGIGRAIPATDARRAHDETVLSS